MNKAKLESYLGKTIIVFFDDGDFEIGTLIKGTKHEEGYYSCSNFYSYSNSVWFRASHVTRVEENKQ